jgi:hypothetical protein
MGDLRHSAPVEEAPPQTSKRAHHSAQGRVVGTATDAGSSLWAVVLVLAIACANVSNRR